MQLDIKQVKIEKTLKDRNYGAVHIVRTCREQPIHRLGTKTQKQTRKMGQIVKTSLNIQNRLN